MSAVTDSIPTQRVESLRRALDRAWGHGETEALDSVLAPSYVRRGRRSEMSLDELKAAIVDMRRSFPDLTMQIERVVTGDDEVALHWTSTGTLQDEYLGLPPTGRQYSVSGVNFARFQGGMIVEENVVYDRRGEYSSLGLPLAGAHGEQAESDTSQDAIKSFHRRVVSGVTVVSTMADGEPRGLAVNAFSSVSLEPPLILVCVMKSSSTYRHLIASKHFAVNLLAYDQLPVVRMFASKNDRKFDHVDWHTGTYGTPLLDGVSASMELELQDTLHASTHTIFIGKVKAVTDGGKAPLVYTEGKFFDGSQLAPAEAPLD